MAVIPVGYGQINWLFEGVGAPTGAQCTLGYELPSGGGTADAEAEFFYDVWRDEILPLQHDGITLVGCLVKHGPNEDGPTGLFTASQNGGVSSPGTSAAISLLVQKRTLVGGRRGRGRMYVPGLTEANVAPDGSILEANRGAFELAFADLMDRMVTVFAIPVVLHSQEAGPMAPTGITNFSVSGTVATQRQRQRR